MSQTRSSPPRGGAQRGLVIARVAGIPVSIGGSWLILAAGLIFLVGSANPQLGTTAYVIGAVYALALLVAVLAHESAHALAARSFGIEVHRIVADLWGGHTAFDGRRTTPGRSAVIAVAGPSANLLLALIAYMAGGSMPAGGTVTAMVSGFATVNGLLAAFNLLPGLPLDGGQLVDSLVWRLTGRRDLGLVAGGWSGRIVTAGVVASALLWPVAQGRQPSIGTIVWAFIIGGFMWSGASNAIAMGKARRVLGAVRVGDVIRPAVPVDPAAPIGSLGQDGVPVARDETGLPTLVTTQVDPAQAPPPQAPVSSIMVRIPAECVVETGPGDDVTQLVTALQRSGVGVAVVTQGGVPYGVATADLINERLQAVS